MTLIKLDKICKTYKDGELLVPVLKNISFEIEKGEFVTIMGPSGSGKSTLLNIIGCLDQPTKGDYYLDNILINNQKDKELSRIRNNFIGFVFQHFHLLSHLKAYENVELPMIYNGMFEKERRPKAKEALEKVGLSNRLNHKPSQLSGGEKQRVAIARSIAIGPDLILADEATGALDSVAGDNIMEIFKTLNETFGMTIIQVTHSKPIALKSQKIIHILDGKINRIEYVKEGEIL
jgi:putative ABC transport system ATP-binding protein